MARSKRFGPSDPAFLILVSLAQGCKHGYAVMKDVEKFSGVSLGAGTLYGAIARLEARQLIEVLSSEDPRRRPYRITKDGRAALQAELDTLEAWTSVGRNRLAPAGAQG
jgi:DNA-binding PadR family transcriptional regulator